MAEEDFFVLCMRQGRREEVGHAWFAEDWDVRRRAAGSGRSTSDAWTTSDGKASRGRRIGRCWWLHCCTHGKMSGGKVK
ncbi:hypothetical protein SORBI_3004G188201 [Sorghum bicolor]|uniref:Uncharacterized protein n=1 Tax=Sorghum bicolor TaxID=4558 RepID=A0A194YQL5_SORBI|nr:hypothetical protein SORBI_3004G188201 [Sorghum bicolor]